MAEAPVQNAGAYKRTVKGNNDWYYGGGDIAYTNASTACTIVPLWRRPGQTVGILINGKIVEYLWHNDDTSDSGLIKKTVDVDLSNYTDRTTDQTIGGNKKFTGLLTTPRIADTGGDDFWLVGGSKGVGIRTQTGQNAQSPVAYLSTSNNTDSVNIQMPSADGTLATKEDISAYDISLKQGVPAEGDTMLKLYNAIIANLVERTFDTLAARNAYNVPRLPFQAFVTDDGDGKWAVYKATSTGVNAAYIKVSDPDLLNAVMTAAQIKTAYESNADRNAFTNALLAKLNGIAAGATVNDTDANLKNRSNHTGSQLAATISDFATAASNALATPLAGKLTGAAATDAETQISAAVTEDNKFVSRLKLFSWLSWRLLQTWVFGNTNDATDLNTAAIIIRGGLSVNKTLMTQSAKILDLVGTGARIVATDANGLLNAPFTVTAPTVTDTATQTLLLTEANWNDSGAYIGAAFSANAIQSQWYRSSNTNYLYYFYDSTTAFRFQVGGIQHIRGMSNSPSASLGTGAGTSSTLSNFAGNDVSFSITFTTGSSPMANGVIATITYNKAYGATPRVFPAALNAASAAAITGILCTSVTTAATVTAVGALAPNTTYSFNFLVAS